ncbi:NAD(P)/FAD-dependent oxidoreductase [Sedimenticola sp.]|uniref:NAD(P)/FAD-dependent oxidoreductase n=1 Tax=Sedimenticola sp. TaxID=1940285 RepID=UPI003D118CDC
MNQSPAASPHAIVIGAGIVGLAVAEKLQSQGMRVTLLEREAVAAGASRGNAGAFAFSDILPLASPGMIKKAFRWLIDPLGPFAVVAADLPWTLPWLLRFLCASRPSRVKRSIQAQSDLMQLAKQAMHDLVARTGLAGMIRSDGALHLYESLAAYRADQANWTLRAAHGIAFERYEGEALHRFQPGLSRHFRVGLFVPAWQTVSNPADFCQAIHYYLGNQGVETRYAEVEGLSGVAGGAEVRLASGERLRADYVVLAAGPWSAELAAPLGDAIPLIGERGYNTSFPREALELRRMLIFCDHGFVVTPLDDAIRVGGASEIARLDRPPNYRRSTAMVRKAQQFLPGLKTDHGEPWMGSRPAIPDTLPVIGRSRVSENIIYAFGHGHLGLTQSAATGQLVSELINGLPTSVDLTPFRPDRF